jgi:hypothetical protein
MTFAGDRPEAGSGAAGEDDGNQHGHDLSVGKKLLMVPHCTKSACR